MRLTNAIFSAVNELGIAFDCQTANDAAMM